jgi:hypothetical protein
MRIAFAGDCHASFPTESHYEGLPGSTFSSAATTTAASRTTAAGTVSPASTTATKPTPSSTLFARTSHIYGERPILELGAMKLADRFLSFFLGFHFHKGKTFGTPSVAISNQGSGLHCAGLRKQVSQIVL